MGGKGAGLGVGDDGVRTNVMLHVFFLVKATFFEGLLKEGAILAPLDNPYRGFDPDLS